MKSLLAQAAVLLALAAHALAVQPDEILKDPALEARARALSTELRCLVCQNQSIDESDAPLARDLRILLREQLQQGKSDTEVMYFIVARYGDYVRLRPPFNSSTIILWGFPFVLLAAAGIYLYSRKPNVSATAEAALSADEEKRLKRLLSGANSTEKP
jgi:cytochrome c-type biogenesis protein CcmH